MIEEATGRAGAGPALDGVPACPGARKASATTARTQKYQLRFMLARFLTKWL
jgi:hypothetical protein